MIIECDHWKQDCSHLVNGFNRQYVEKGLLDTDVWDISSAHTAVIPNHGTGICVPHKSGNGVYPKFITKEAYDKVRALMEKNIVKL